MAKTHTVRLSALNIKTHPHSSENYAKLWIKASSLNRAVKLIGETWGMIGTAFPIHSDKPEKGIQGELYRFTHIDEEADWFDVSKKERVNPDDLEELVVIPNNLKPNLRRIRYVFYPECHRLVFTSSYLESRLSSQLATRLLLGVLKDQRLIEFANNLAITPEQSRETIEKIFSNTQIQHLKIVVEIPNGDDDGNDEESLEAVLDEQGASKVVVELSAQRNKSIKLNSKNQKLAYLAASNGHVEASGTNLEGEKIRVNTEDHPLIKTAKYNTEYNFSDWFLNAAQKLLKTIMQHS